MARVFLYIGNGILIWLCVNAYAEHSLIVWNDSIAYLNVVLTHTEAEIYCVDGEGIKKSRQKCKRKNPLSERAFIAG